MKRTRQTPDVFRAIADFTYDWETWVDAGGRTAWINPAVMRMTGYGVEECLRMRGYPLSLVHVDDRKRIRAALEGARRGSSGNDVELRVVHKDGSSRWLAMSWQPIVLDGKAFGYRTSVRDIHERKKAEEVLRAADQAKAEFLAIMSHEIRSPMHAIAGYAQMLDRTEMRLEQRGYVEVILRENAALLRIVDDVLDFSALQVGKVGLEHVAFAYRDVVRTVVDATYPRARSKGVTVRARVHRSLPPRLLGDPQRIRQILLNLVDNAVRLTSEGGVTIDVRRVGGEVVTRVTDTGPGISSARLARLFEMFSRADPKASRRHGGSGLGLAIAKRLCERMGGSIRATSKPGEGATFAFRLPLEVAPGSVTPRAPVPPRSPPALPSLASRVPLRILVVDDSKVARDVAREFLRVLGYAPDLARSGRQAITRVQQSTYDVVLLDMQMPGLDGLAAARLLRRAAGAPIWIAALTANVFVTAGTDLDAVMTKPLDLSVLQSVLAAKLEPDVVQSLVEPRAGRPPILASALGRIKNEGTRALDELSAAVSAGDRRRSDAAAHRFKGIALLAGARGLAAQVEAPGLGGADLALVRDAFTRVVATLEGRLSRAIGSHAASPP